jgi:hypothetical protein
MANGKEKETKAGKEIARRQLVVGPLGDRVLLDGIHGKIISIEPITSLGLITVLAEEEDWGGPAGKPVKKMPDCCDGIVGEAIRPSCRIQSAALSADFSQVVVEVTATHVCGIKSMGFFVGEISYQVLPPAPGAPPDAPTVIRRSVSLISINGNPIVGAVQYDCPSNIRTRTHTFRVPTNGLVGRRFAVVVNAKSCCNVEGMHDSDWPAYDTTRDFFII